MWPAVHGYEAAHDRMVHRTGAYQETLLGIDRMRAAGMEVGCNVFLTSENVGGFDALIADLLAHGVTQFAVGPASYVPTARSRRYEALRPRLEHLLPLVERVCALPGPCFHHDEWLDLAAHTDAAYVRQALSGAWPGLRKATKGNSRWCAVPIWTSTGAQLGGIVVAMAISVMMTHTRCCKPPWPTEVTPKTPCGSRSIRFPPSRNSPGATVTPRETKCISMRSHRADAGLTLRSGSSNGDGRLGIPAPLSDWIEPIQVRICGANFGNKSRRIKWLPIWRDSASFVT